MTFPAANFEHLQRLSDDTGLIEHAWYDLPQRRSGYNVDDNARALIAICRQPAPSPVLVRLATRYLTFIQHARRTDGRFHNCLSYDRNWVDEYGSDDCHGRALWALGTAASAGPSTSIRRTARRLFEVSIGLDTPSPRANAFAVLGAIELLNEHPQHVAAQSLLEHCGARLPWPRTGSWPWPEHRLAYDNARIPQALMLYAERCGTPQQQRSALALLEWLVAQESRSGHLSFAPVGGWTAGEPRPGFDQQPVEAAAMADACASAFELTTDGIWAERVLSAAHWFVGANDVGVQIYDPHTGGCRDGLHADQANENQGAESTLACITTFQHAARVDAQSRSRRQYSERAHQVDFMGHRRANDPVGGAVG
jgi:hypothetical protein